MKDKAKNRSDSLPIQGITKASKKAKNKCRSLSPTGFKTTPFKVAVSRLNFSEIATPVKKSTIKTTPTKAQQKQFEPSVIKKFENLQKMDIKKCRVLIKRQDLEDLQKSFVESFSASKGKKKRGPKPASEKRKEERKAAARSPSPKKIKTSDRSISPKKLKSPKSGNESNDKKSKSGFFIKLQTPNSSKKSSLKVSTGSPVRKEVGEWPGASPKKLSVTPTKFSRSHLIQKFGKRFFSSVVKMEHCTHPLMVEFEAEARKQRSKRKLSKNLSVSFQQEVEILDHSPTNRNRSKLYTSIEKPSLVKTPLPQRLQKIENGKVVIDTELDESFFLTNNLEAIEAASTPIRTNINGQKGSNKSSRGNKKSEPLLPILGINLLKNQDDDDDDEDAEFIVPEVDIPDKLKVACSTSSGISVASITKAVRLKDTPPTPDSNNIKSKTPKKSANSKKTIEKSPPVTKTAQPKKFGKSGKKNESKDGDKTKKKDSNIKKESSPKKDNSSKKNSPSSSKKNKKERLSGEKKQENLKENEENAETTANIENSKNDNTGINSSKKVNHSESAASLDKTTCSALPSESLSSHEAAFDNLLNKPGPDNTEKSSSKDDLLNEKKLNESAGKSSQCEEDFQNFEHLKEDKERKNSKDNIETNEENESFRLRSDGDSSNDSFSSAIDVVPGANNNKDSVNDRPSQSITISEESNDSDCFEKRTHNSDKDKKVQSFEENEKQKENNSDGERDQETAEKEGRSNSFSFDMEPLAVESVDSSNQKNNDDEDDTDDCGGADDANQESGMRETTASGSFDSLKKNRETTSSMDDEYLSEKNNDQMYDLAANLVEV